MKDVHLVELVLVIQLGVGCAHTFPPVSPAETIARARRDCDRLAQTRLKAPPKTDVERQLRQIKRALALKKRRRAARLADELATECRQEAERRDEVFALREAVNRDRDKLDPTLYARFLEQVDRGDYSLAILCGEGLLQQQPERCSLQPDRRIRAITKITMRADGKVIKHVKTVGEQAPPVKTSPAAAGQARQGTTAAADPETAQISESDFAVDVMAQRASEPDEPTSARFWPWIVMGSGGALLVGGAIAAGLAQGRHDDLEQSCPACSQDDIDGGKRMALSADILFGTGAAAVIGGVLWYLLQPRTAGSRDVDAAQKPMLRPTVGGLSFGGRF